ncbi:MAG: tetratricopeptide repeat protein [PVC group bacterium]
MTDKSGYVFEAAEADFTRTVLERSRELPVIVDFWADWCAPCRMLGPVLEEAVAEQKGRIVLAKVDVEKSPGLAARYGIQSIPAVKIFAGGEVVSEFVGALPADRVRKIISGILPDEKAPRIEEANGYLAGGRWEEAEKIYRELLEGDSRNPAASLGMGIITFQQGRFEEAEKYLAAVTRGTPGYDKVPPMLSRIYFQRLAVPDLNEITAALKASPEDPPALFSLAVIYARGGEYERALDTLLQVLRIDKSFEDGVARDAYVKIIEFLGRSSPAGKKYERDLSMILFS